MAYQPGLILQDKFTPAPNTLEDSQKIKQEAQDYAIAQERQRIASIAGNLKNKFDTDTLANREAAEGYETQSKGLAIPGEQLGAQQANIGKGYLDQMYPGSNSAIQAPSNIPPWAAQSQPAPQNGAPMQVPPQMQEAPPHSSDVPQNVPPGMAQSQQGFNNPFAGKDLNELIRIQKEQGAAMPPIAANILNGTVALKMQEARNAMYQDMESGTDNAGVPWPKRIQATGSNVHAAANAFNEFRNKHPVLGLLPENEQAKIQTETFKAQPQPNGAMIMNTPPPNTVRDDAIKRIAEGKSTVSQEMAKSGRGGPAAQIYHDQLVEGVPLYIRPGEDKPLRPDFSEAEDEGGNKFAQSGKIKASLTQMENAYSTVGRLREVFGKLKNGQFPDLNAAINAGAVHIGDVNAARANIAEILGNDELTKAFAAGGVPTDKLRDMASALVNKNLSPQQMNAQFDELLQGTERQYNAYVQQSAGHIKPLDTSKYKAASAAISHPQASEAEQWAKANPNDPRAKIILQRLGK